MSELDAPSTERSAGSGADYLFDDIRVDARARRVFKAEIELALEPKAYGVLLTLLAQPHVAIERDQLLDTVWGHRHVTPAVLNRVIALLRRALGDNADHPRLIRTVHGVGYSFIGELRPIEPPPVASTALAAPASAAIDPVAAATAPDLPGPGFRYRRHALVVLLTAAFALVGILLTRAHDPAPNVVAASQPAPVLAATPAGVRIAVLPIDPGNTHDPLLARGLTETLCDALERVPAFIVTGLASSRVAADTAHDPRELARMLGTDHLLRASLAAEDGQLELRLQLLAARDGSVLWSEAYRRPREQLLDVLAPALASMQQTLLPNSNGVNADPDLGNSGAAALAIYWSASRGKATTREQRIETLAQLRRAVAENPQDALGWTAIAIVERTRYMYGEGSFADTLGAARSAIERALEINPDLIDAMTAKAFILTALWRSPEALGISRRAIELAPNNARTIVTRANVLGYMGRVRESLALRQRAVALDPLAPYPLFSMYVDYLGLGQRQAALDVIERSEQSALPGGRSTENVRSRIALAFGDIAQSLSETPEDEGTSPRPFSIYRTLNRAYAWSMLGDSAKADAALAELKVDLPEVPAYVETWLTVHWARKDYAKALNWIETDGKHAAEDPWQHAASAQARALAGDAAGALADYALALDAPADRDLIAHNWFPGRFGLAQLANWIALRKASGLPYQEQLDDYERRLDDAVAAGTALPLMDYHRAALAALRDDTVAADHWLSSALERGWVDPLAFDVDLTWRPFARSEWLQGQRAAQAARIDGERRRMSAHSP